MNFFDTRIITPAGNAWLIGVLAGLAEGGLDVTDAELTIGTSAGATAAAQIGGAQPSEHLASILAAPPQPPSSPMLDHLRRTEDVFAASQDPADMRRRQGASALALPAPADHSERWRATVAARLPHADWPQRDVWLTAIDARTGEPVVFDRNSGVDLVDAVAISTSGGLPFALGEHRYLDGGYRRSSENADLAAGSARVLVLSPLGGRTRAPLEWRMQLAAQEDELRAGGSRVASVLPDAASLDAFGPNMMDLSRRPAAARAGQDQGAALAAELGAFWG
ncbi:patatin-like phospholipase family protein [Microbacteriaceae bacterium VKM Ac-2854]|nr:patatin-like phospholipase family protein [Microbacteriaceae bacterium VKM Ac-2854]